MAEQIMMEVLELVVKDMLEENLAQVLVLVLNPVVLVAEVSPLSEQMLLVQVLLLLVVMVVLE